MTASLTLKKNMGYDFLHGLLAQSVEQRTENPRVRGSIPRQPTIFSLCYKDLLGLGIYLFCS